MSKGQNNSLSFHTNQKQSFEFKDEDYVQVLRSKPNIRKNENNAVNLQKIEENESKNYKKIFEISVSDRDNKNETRTNSNRIFSSGNENNENVKPTTEFIFNSKKSKPEENYNYQQIKNDENRKHLMLEEENPLMNGCNKGKITEIYNGKIYQEELKQEKLREELKQKIAKERAKSTDSIKDNSGRQKEDINIRPINNDEDIKEISPNVKSKLMERLNKGKIRAMANSAEKVEKMPKFNKNNDILFKAKMLEGILAKGNGNTSAKENKIEIEYEKNEDKNKQNENNDCVVVKKKKKKPLAFEE